MRRMLGPGRDRIRAVILVAAALAVQSCAGGDPADGAGRRLPVETTESTSASGNFVCFRIAASAPAELTAFEHLLKAAGVADDSNIRGGLKADAAVSVRLEPNVAAASWIDELPPIVTGDAAIRSIEPSAADCAVVEA